MNAKFTRCILLITLLLLLGTLAVSAGCRKEEEKQLQPAPSAPVGPPPAEPPLAIQLSRTLVPNIDLDVYIYLKQSEPTTLSSDMLNLPFDVAVESAAIWGVFTEDKLALGGRFTLTSADDASSLYDEITPERETWVMLSGSSIYFAQGSGDAVETLKRAISNNYFKYYDDSKALQEVAALPDGGQTRLAAVVIIKPGKVILDRIVDEANLGSAGLSDFMFRVARLQVIVGGLYAPGHINVAEIAEAVEQGDNNGGIWESDIGVLVSVKSGLPGFIMGPVVRGLLDMVKFTETKLGELTLYKGSLDIDSRKTVPVLVRIKGNRIFAAISGKETYAQTLITSINN